MGMKTLTSHFVSKEGALKKEKKRASYVLPDCYYYIPPMNYIGTQITSRTQKVLALNSKMNGAKILR